MKFHLVAALLLAIACSSLVRGWNDHAYTQSVNFGHYNKKGASVSYALWGVPLASLDIWYDGGWIQGLQGTFATGEMGDYVGVQGSQSKTLTFGPDETITGICTTLAGDKVGVVYITISTSAGQTVSAGVSNPATSSQRTCYTMWDFGSGMMTGYNATWGTHLDSFAFEFYKPITSVELSNFVYTNNPIGEKWGITPTAVGSAKLTTTRNGTWTFEGIQTHTETHSWSSSISNRFGASVTVSGGFMFLTVSATASWDITSTSTHGSEVSSTNTQRFSLSGSNGPVKCTATMSQGKLDLHWTASITIKFAGGIDPLVNGGPNYRGMYKNAVFAAVDASCSPV